MSCTPKLQHQKPLLIITSLLATAIAFAVFFPALYGGFIFDDYPIFAENQVIQQAGWHWAGWLRVWHWSLSNIQRPFAMFTYAFNYAVGSSTYGFKLTNLCIHLLNMVLVFLLTNQLLQAAWQPRKNEDGASTHRRTNYWALGIAMAWAVHPLQVSTVMYVVQRMEMMGFTFVLLALLAYWHARQQQAFGQRAWPWLLLSGALCITGYFAKETAVLVPGYTLLIELTLLHFAAAKPSITRTWKALYAIGGVAATLVLLFYVLPHFAQPINFAGRDFTAWQRELTQLRVLPMYLYWSVLPLPSHLQFYYDNYQASTGVLHPITTLLGGLLLLGLLLLAIAVRLRRPLLALGIGWFFVAHALTSGPLALELVFEHRNYPALLGVLLAVADLFQLLSRRSDTPVMGLIAGILILNLGFLTVLRASTWSSPFQLAVALADANPDSLRAALDLARRYMAMSQGNADSPLFSMSVKELERAARLTAASPLPEEALLLVAADHPGMPTQPWWDSLRLKLQTKPLQPDSYKTLHNLMMHRVAGNTGIDAQQLAQAYAIAIARNPSRQSLHVEYAELAGSALHDPTLASDQWRQALSLENNVAGYSEQLSSYLVENHRNQEALAVVDQAWALQPGLRKDTTLLAVKSQAEKDLNASQSSSGLTQPIKN